MCLTDLDPAQSEVIGLPNLAGALIRRLQCPIGGMIGDPNYGYFLIGEIDDDIVDSDVARICSNIDREFQKDERVTSSRTTGTFAAGQLTTTSTVYTAAGPFKLVLGITTIIQILSGTSVAFNNTTVPSLLISSPAPVLPSITNPGGDMMVRFAINNSASQSSATQIPSGSVVLRAMLDMVSTDLTTPVAFSGGATITIGRLGTANLLADVGDFDPTTSGNVYDALDPISWGSSASVLVTIGGSPAAGAGTVVVTYLPPTAIGS